MHLYEGHFWGMHFIWWIIRLVFLFWIFLTPWDVPGQKTRKESLCKFLKRDWPQGRSILRNLKKGKNCWKEDKQAFKLL